jgi:hypothetical protein
MPHKTKLDLDWIGPSGAEPLAEVLALQEAAGAGELYDLPVEAHEQAALMHEKAG